MKPFLKHYHIILISILIVPFLIENSSIASTKRKNEQNFIKKNQIIEPKISLFRKLDFYNDSIKICNKSSEDLVKYFETGNTEYVKLYEYSEEEEMKDHILYLINYISDEDNKEENLKKYMTRFVPVFLFFIVAICSIPGWIICFCCCCYNCYCFSCCKKPECRLPFFIVVSIMNAIIIIISIECLAKVNNIFVGLTNTECSVLKFINEVLEGESKNTIPKWGGIQGIIGIFGNTISQIDEMVKKDTQSEIRLKMNNYKTAKEGFINSLINICNNVNNDENYLYDSLILDIAKKFGKYESGKFTEGSYAEKWVLQANFSNNIQESYNIFGNIITSNIRETMGIANDIIEDMEDSIENIKDSIGEVVLNYSEKIDEIGRLFFEVIFSTLLFFSVVFEILLVFLFLFSSRKCIGYFCFIRFSVKILIHILWNIFALLMLFVLLLGTGIALIGTLGEDIFQVFSYIISEENLQSESPKIIEEEPIIFDICINGDGIIYDYLGIESDLGNIDILKTLTIKVDELIENIMANEAQTDVDLVYAILILEIETKKRENNFGLINNNPSNTNIEYILTNTILELNQELNDCSLKERYSFSCNNDFPNMDEASCSGTSSDTEKCINPYSCNNNELENRYTSSCTNANELGKVINKIISAINYLDDNDYGLKKKAADVKALYRQLLRDEKEALRDYTNKFKILTIVYDNFVGNGSILGILNCAFLGKNVKVMLNYLDDSVGKQFRNLGIEMFFTGVAMALSISFTIILVIIFNSTIDLREKQKQEMDKIKEIQNNENNLQVPYNPNPLQQYKEFQ